MDIAYALNIVVGRTGHGRFRELCDPSHPAYDPRYVPVVIRMAEGIPPDVPATIPVAEAIALNRRMAACPYRSTGPGCGCAGARCALRGAAIVSHRDCFSCLERYPG